VLKIRKTGIEYIDKTLGRLYEGLSILVASDSFTLNDADRLAGLVGLNFMREGGAVITVHANLPFYKISKEIKNYYSDEKNKAFQEAVKEGRFYYLDLVSGENRLNKNYNDVKNVKGIANDPNRIVYEINVAKKQIKQEFPDTPILVLYLNLSSSIVDFDSKTVLKMTRKLTIDTKREGDIFLGVANRDIHELQVTNTLNHIVDYAVNFAFETIDDKKQSYIYVSRTPLVREAHKILNQRLAYFFTPDNLITLFPLYYTFDELKESMSFSETGQVSVLGWNHIITPTQTFLLFLETIKKLYNQEEYQKVLYDLGLNMGKGIANLIESERRLTDKKLFEEVLKYNTVTGWGRHFSIEGSIDEGKLKIAGISTIGLTANHTDHPICTFVTGALAGILQAATKKEWKGRETKCIAKGDPHCEFELELK
jgi:predicted hydrocarbon binding protein